MNATKRNQPKTTTLRTPDFPWATKTAAAVAMANDSHFYFVRVKQSEVYSHFVGNDDKPSKAAEQAAVVLKAIRTEAAKKVREGGKDLKWFRDFCKGAATAVKERAEQIAPTLTDDEANAKFLADNGVDVRMVILSEQDAHNKAAKEGYAFGASLTIRPRVSKHAH